MRLSSVAISSEYVLFLKLSLKPTFLKKITYSSRCLNIKNIWFPIPSPFIDLKIWTISFEHKWTIFIQHSEHTRTPRSSIKPPINWIIIRIALRFEKDIMVTTCIELQVAFFIITMYLNTRYDCYILEQNNEWHPRLVRYKRQSKATTK